MCDKGSPLSDAERESKFPSDAKRDSRVSSLRADTTVSACASIVADAIRVFTSHEVSARELPRNALGTIGPLINALGDAFAAEVLRKLVTRSCRPLPPT